MSISDCQCILHRDVYVVAQNGDAILNEHEVCVCCFIRDRLRDIANYGSIFQDGTRVLACDLDMVGYLGMAIFTVPVGMIATPVWAELL